MLLDVVIIVGDGVVDSLMVVVLFGCDEGISGIISGFNTPAMASVDCTVVVATSDGLDEVVGSGREGSVNNGMDDEYAGPFCVVELVVDSSACVLCL